MNSAISPLETLNSLSLNLSEFSKISIEDVERIREASTDDSFRITQRVLTWVDVQMNYPAAKDGWVSDNGLPSPFDSANPVVPLRFWFVIGITIKPMQHSPQLFCWPCDFRGPFFFIIQQFCLDVKFKMDGTGD